jgi:predicted ester cyclase
MSSIKETAEQFFDACETGAGWEECQQYCHPEASFSAQAGALAEVDSLQGYTDWMKGLLTPIPDGKYELRAFAVDEDRNNVTAFAVFRGTHTGQGGPVPPTGKQIEADYVYVMQFEGDKIRHMTKIWNDGISLQQLGWA